MAICYRIFITLTNIFFPPLAVIFLTGFGMDTMINALLFLAAIIPSHIHGFYLSCTYFHRRRKVRKGRWPGGPKPLIYSDNVLCGGARWDEAQRLKRLEQGGGPVDSEKLELRKQRRASRRESRRVSRRPGGYGESRQASHASVAGGGGYGGLRYGLGDGDAAGWNASNGVVGPGYGPGFGPDGRAYRGVMRRARTAC